LTIRIVALAALVGVLAVLVVPGTAGAQNECQGVPTCIPVEGPWVVVPASGEVEFALSCPQGKGIVAGTDVLASSLDVHVTFDGNLGAPIAYGRTTSTGVLFRAVSGRHRLGSFKPFIGCIPAPASVRNTIAAKPTPAGPPLQLVSKLVRLSPGNQKVVTLGCPSGQALVDSWSTPSFDTVNEPDPGLASAIAVKTTISGDRARLAISASEALPAGSHAEVQIGVRCAD
jgi:hypothetical protein